MKSENKDPYYYNDIGVVHISYGDSNGREGTIHQGHCKGFKPCLTASRIDRKGSELLQENQQVIFSVPKIVFKLDTPQPC